ncbi:flagellar motor switch phosphatase FliY [Pseudobutyrivibrio sp.]|uniref:flagellar motor switch phosphatase FliY n=1 Tax=Pseudobutyrivibrio sp. TaxID=2014367 RepID=UPI001D557A8D|nr:flagellar motor switch phosphatase FliY [Pseudobutyrivibrio sp.]MBE5910987.1 flagellar motor switch phosphatase FliY [Pseudobutyrivibrio sp.]
MADIELTKQQQDTLGEIANISMGSSATSLSALLNNLKVDITTPKIEFIRKSEALDDYHNVCVLVHINYVKGLSGSNVLILKENDVKIIADLMMGGQGVAGPDEIGEIQLSAVSEAMNQMMGSAASSMSQLLNRVVDISPPKTDNIDVESVKIFERLFESPEIDFVKITFNLKIGTVVDSVMVQLYPISFAKDMVSLFENSND